GADLTTRALPQNINCQSAPGRPTLCTILFPGGNQMQAYVDPAKPGKSNVHFTFFDAKGNELPIASASVSGLAPGGASEMLRTRRFSAGHFVSDVTLVPGTWRFRVHATGRDNTSYDAYFDQAIAS